MPIWCSLWKRYSETVTGFVRLCSLMPGMLASVFLTMCAVLVWDKNEVYRAELARTGRR